MTKRFGVAALLLTVGSVGVLTAPAAVAVTVTDEAALRAQFASPATTSITLGADITLSDCAAGDVGRPAGAPVLTIDGGGHTITQTCAGSRVLSDLGSGLALDNITVTGGDEDPDLGTDAVPALGGGIYEASGALTLDHAAVTGNQVHDIHDPAYGGGVYAGGPLRATASSISTNMATGSGGNAGGGVYAVSTVSLDSSTVAGNGIANGTGGADGGGILAEGSLTLVNSTVTYNGSGGIGSHGGGLSGTVIHLVYSTVANNSADTGTDVYQTDATSTAYASIVGEEYNGVITVPNCSGAFVSLGHNASASALCGFSNTAAGDIPPSAMSGFLFPPIADNGGPTQTLLPPADSVLVDAIPGSDCAAGPAVGITTDQRGYGRPAGAACDIGAVELGAVPVTTTTVAGPSTTTAGSGSTTSVAGSSTTVAAEPATAVPAAPTYTG